MSISFQELMQIPLCESAGKRCCPSNLPRVVPRGRAYECMACLIPRPENKRSKSRLSMWGALYGMDVSDRALHTTKVI